MSILMTKITACLEVMLEMARDIRPEHRDDRTWAQHVLTLVKGQEGFERLVIFAVDTDFATVTHILVRVQDSISPDVSLSVAQVLDCLETCKALFKQGRIFEAAPNGTYTNELLRNLCASRRAREFGWPDQRASSQALAKPMSYAKKLYQTVEEFFNLNFPDHAWRQKFAAFHCGPDQKLALDTRLRYIEELAAKEGLDKVEEQ